MVNVTCVGAGRCPKLKTKFKKNQLSFISFFVTPIPVYVKVVDTFYYLIQQIISPMRWLPGNMKKVF